MNIPILVPRVPKLESLLPFLERIDQSRWYSNFGPLENELRENIAKYLGCSAANVATAANATLAIQGAIETSGYALKNWSVPSWTFAASALAGLKASREIEFVDVDEEWRGQFGKEHDYILDVLPFGDDLDGSRYSYKKVVVVDAAASIANIKNSFHKIKGKRVIVVVSMHSTKLLPAGEGAFVFSENLEWIESFRAWTNFGFQSDRTSSLLGTNAKFSEYAAAVGLASCQKFADYRERFASLGVEFLERTHSFGLKCHPAMEKGLVTPYWIIQLPTVQHKESLIQRSKLLGIETREWWKQGCHRMPIFQHVNHAGLTRTELIASTTIGLPFHLNLSQTDKDEIFGLLEFVTS